MPVGSERCRLVGITMWQVESLIGLKRLDRPLKDVRQVSFTVLVVWVCRNSGSRNLQSAARCDDQIDLHQALVCQILV